MTALLLEMNDKGCGLAAHPSILLARPGWTVKKKNEGKQACFPAGQGLTFNRPYAYLGKNEGGKGLCPVDKPSGG